MRHAQMPPTSRLLILMRHGTAVARGEGVGDFERVLTAAGVAECERTAGKLRRMKVAAELIISSPADRALETAHAVADKLGYDYHRIELADTLYEAESIRPVLAQVQHLDDTLSTVALCGHNPLFDDLAVHLVSGFSRTIPKGAAVGISFVSPTWSGVKRQSGRLEFFVTPSASRSQREPVTRRGRA